MKRVIIKTSSLHKSFYTGIQEVPVLKGLSFDVEKGTFLIIFGPSGCGKSTLLHVVLGLETPTKGEVNFLGEDLYQNTSEDYRSDLRKKHVGMVYQQPNWVKSLTVVENVAFPLLLLGVEKKKTLEKAHQTLKSVEMVDWANYLPTELSSGQQQRVALARALVADPKLIIADEPTGNLDYESGQELMQLLTDLNRQGKTIIMVTHDLEYLRFAKTAIQMFDGKVIGCYQEDKIKELVAELKSKRGELA